MGKLLLAFLTVTSALVAVQTAAAMGLAGVATNLIVAEELADITVQTAAVASHCMPTRLRSIRVPFGGKPGAPMTYASLASQQNLLGMINDNEGGTCPAPAIDQVVLVSRAPGGALHLPPFILPPMQYTESWRVHCGAAVRQMLATFKEDSEGPAGIARVKRQP